MKWVSEGWCEFYSVPYSMKTALSEPDIEALKAIPDSYTGIVFSSCYYHVSLTTHAIQLLRASC